METKPLNGKVAIVTGSGTGIGRAIAKTLAANGAAVMLAGRREAPLQAVQAEIQAAGGVAAYMSSDVGNLDQCAALVKGTVDKFGRLDILVNNATAQKAPNGPRPERLQDVPVEDWQFSFNVNVLGPFVLCREAIPHLAKHDRAFIVNIGAIGTRRMYSGGSYGVYVATKNAMRGMTVSLSKELRQYTGIRCHIVHPGAVLTERMAESLAKGTATSGVGNSSKDIANAKHISTQDMADAVLFLVTRTGNGMIDEVAVRREDADYWCFE